MMLVVVLECAAQADQGRGHIRLVHECDVVILHGLDEGLGHSVALRRTHRCRQRLKALLLGKALRMPI